MNRIGIVMLLGFAAVSCKMADTASELFHGEVVARVGDHRLHRQELAKFIPEGASPEDSTALAQRYIKAWAEDLILLDMAQQQLSKEEKDVSKELEEYRRTLIKYRYEQLYINQRLDTLVTEDEIRQYYEAHTDKFTLDRPLLKARYMIIPAKSRNLKTLKKLMSSDDDNDIMQADSLAFNTAIKYADASDTWMDALNLARELDTDYKTLMGSVNNSFAEVKDDSGNIHIAYILEMIPRGKPAPVEYCQDRINDIILNSRRHQLLLELEQKLLEDAIENNKFVIFQDE